MEGNERPGLINPGQSNWLRVKATHPESTLWPIKSQHPHAAISPLPFSSSSFVGKALINIDFTVHSGGPIADSFYLFKRPICNNSVRVRMPISPLIYTLIPPLPATLIYSFELKRGDRDVTISPGLVGAGGGEGDEMRFPGHWRLLVICHTPCQCDVIIPC